MRSGIREEIHVVAARDPAPQHFSGCEQRPIVHELWGDEARLARPDRLLEPILEGQVSRYIARSNSKGIANASAILVDTRDMSVRALVGSAGVYGAACASE